MATETASRMAQWHELAQQLRVDSIRSTTQAGSGHATEIVRYPEAGHGFHCDQRASFEAKSAEDAWARTLAWFNEHLT